MAAEAAACLPAWAWRRVCAAAGPPAWERGWKGLDVAAKPFHVPLGGAAPVNGSSSGRQPQQAALLLGFRLGAEPSLGLGAGIPDWRLHGCSDAAPLLTTSQAESTPQAHRKPTASPPQAPLLAYY